MNRVYFLHAHQSTICYLLTKTRPPSFILLVWEIVWLNRYNRELSLSLDHIPRGICPNLQAGLFNRQQSLQGGVIWVYQLDRKDCNDYIKEWVWWKRWTCSLTNKRVFSSVVCSMEGWKRDWCELLRLQ